jgi:hypothetical protein
MHQDVFDYFFYSNDDEKETNSSGKYSFSYQDI